MPVRNEAGTRRREAILQHAADLASVEGLEGLTIGRLAGELDMSKSGLFDHFGSKEGLQVATVQTAKAKLWSEVVEPASTATPGLDRMRALIEGYLDYLQREVFPGGCFLSAASAEFDGRPGPVRDAIATSIRAWGAELETHAGIALRQGELPDGTDPAQLVFELGAYATRANAIFQLYRDPAVFERARVAVTKALG